MKGKAHLQAGEGSKNPIARRFKGGKSQEFGGTSSKRKADRTPLREIE